MNDQDNKADSSQQNHPQNQRSQAPQDHRSGPTPTAPSGMPMPQQFGQPTNPASAGVPPNVAPVAGNQQQSDPKPEDITPANFQLGKLFLDKISIKVPANNLTFDEEKFINLLAGSISLSKEEKKRIIDTIPKLRQEQIDELTRIFEDEREKFAQLSKKHLPKLEKLAQQHFQEWLDLEVSYKSDKRTEEDEAEADKIRKQLGI